jgi:hypothetical protein
MRGLAETIGGQANCAMPSIRYTTFVDRLKDEKKNLEERLLAVNDVLKSLEKAPEVANVVEALNKLGY